MSIFLGIDVGGSTTKVAGINERKEIISPLQVRAGDQITALYGALGSFLTKSGLDFGDIEKIALTGVGASMTAGDIYGIPTVRVDEFEAVGRGGLLAAGLEAAIVVSMGTGTAYVRAEKNTFTHIGGSGVGGGTLLGLGYALLNTKNFDAICEMAQKGDLHQVDLEVGDICNKDILTLPPHTTAANFGKIENRATDSDMALGLINMVLQTIGSLAAFACRNDRLSAAVLTGALTSLPQAGAVFQGLEALYKITFVIPENAVFATAIGAAEKLL